jgi:hypothetical protein
MNPRVVPSGFLFDDVPMQKIQFGSIILIMAAALFFVTTASVALGAPGAPGTPGKPAVPGKKESFFYRVPNESDIPHLLEECPSIDREAALANEE